MSFTRVRRWRVAISVALGLAGAGVVIGRPGVVLGAAIPIGYVAYSALTSAIPVGSAITVTRSITPQHTAPGQTVAVEITVTNTGERPITDLRIVDGVPDALPVVRGTPRGATGLRPGESTTIQYTVRVRHGEFEFTDPRVRTRSLSGASVYTAQPEAAGETTVIGRVRPELWPLTTHPTGIAGQQPVDRGGPGLEFFGTREYRPGDPVRRIDWRRYAKERQLTTVTYRQHEAMQVIVVVDARPAATVAASTTGATGVELSVHAAGEAITALGGGRQQIGLLVLGCTDSQTGQQPVWIPPAAGTAARTRIFDRLDQAVETAMNRGGQEDLTAPTVETLRMTATEPLCDATGRDADTIRTMMDTHAESQVIVCSPLCDQYPMEVATYAQLTGHPVTVITPDVTAARTPGGIVADSQRAVRIDSLRRRGLTVIDWTPGRPLAQALSGTEQSEQQSGLSRPTGHHMSTPSQS